MASCTNQPALKGKCSVEFFRVDIGGHYPYNVVLIMLGEFEYLLLAASARLGDRAYGAAIRLEIEDCTGGRCSLGALYTTLDRLEAKGLVKTRMGDPTPQRGGRPKRMVRVTPKGERAAADFYNAIARASRGLSWKSKTVRGQT